MRVVAIIVGLLGLVAAGEAPPIAVVASTSIVADWVREVGGDRVRIRCLAGPDADVHAVDPDPGMARDITRAQLVVSIGLDLEPWMDRLVLAAGARDRHLVLGPLAGDSLIRLTTPAGGSGGHQHHGHRHGSDFDPHIWHDPILVAEFLLPALGERLASLDTGDAAGHRARAAAYAERLRALHVEGLAMLAVIPESRRQLVTAHDALAYFARSFGCTQLGDLLGSLSTEAAEPTPRRMAELIAQIRAAGVPAIFGENVAVHPALAAVGRSAGVPVVQLYTDALAASGEASTYEGFLRANLRRVVEALR